MAELDRFFPFFHSLGILRDFVPDRSKFFLAVN